MNVTYGNFCISLERVLFSSEGQMFENSHKNPVTLCDENDDDDDSIDWDSSDDESSSSDSDIGGEGGPMQLTASMFIKK